MNQRNYLSRYTRPLARGRIFIKIYQNENISFPILDLTCIFAKTYLRVAQRSLKLIQGLSQSKEKPCEPCCYTVTVSPLTIYANLLTSCLTCEQLLFAKGKSSYAHNIFLCSNGKQSGGKGSVRNYIDYLWWLKYQMADQTKHLLW